MIITNERKMEVNGTIAMVSEQLSAATTTDEVIAILAQQGGNITVEELTELLPDEIPAAEGAELDEDALAGVSGGSLRSVITSAINRIKAVLYTAGGGGGNGSFGGGGGGTR